MSSDTSIIVSRLLQYPIFARAAHERNWLVYALVDRDGKKPLKVPQLNGSNASFDDAAQYTLEEALSVSDRVGYVARKGSAMVGVDYDNCFTEDDLDDHIDVLLDDVYAEVSPSGNGVRVLLPRMAGDFWSRERSDVGFFGADNKWFTVTFDSLYDEVVFGDSDAIRRSVSHLRLERRSERNEVAALRGKKGDGGKWWFDLPFEWQERSLIDALSAIPPEVANNDEDWFQISMALHSTGYDWVKGIWDQWSQAIAEDANPDSYNEQQNEMRWNSFTRSAQGKTIAHVFWVAREHGWDQDGLKQQYHDYLNPPDEVFDPKPTGLKPFVRVKPEDIPPRPWLLGTYILRGAVTVVSAAGGTGKSVLLLTWAAAMASGKQLVGPAPHKRMKVAVWSGEDNAGEMQRRMTAVIERHGVDPSGYLFIETSKERNMTLVTEGERGALKVHHERVDLAIQHLKDAGVDVLIVDPMVSLHGVNENSNAHMDTVMDCLIRIAEEADVAVAVVHHVGKGSLRDDSKSDPADAARGASAIINRARIGLALRNMSESEAAQAQFPLDARYRFVQIMDAKSNNAARSGTASGTWFELENFALHNKTEEYPEGDHIGVPVPYNGAALAKVTNLEAFVKVAAAMEGEQPLEAASRRDKAEARNGLWIGHLVADACNLNFGEYSRKELRNPQQNANYERVQEIISAMVTDKILERVSVPAPDRKTTQGYTLRKGYIKRIERIRNELAIKDEWAK